MEQALPPTIHFQVTSRCNNNCQHCFGPDKNTPEMSISQIKKVLAIIIPGGVKNIHLTGGEPLLRADFSEIINLFSRYGINTILDTNTDYFSKYQELITKKISVIGLPIDFPNKSFRNDNNLKNIEKVLKYYKKKKGPKIRILTTVTQANIYQLKDIGLFIKNYKIDVWRIMQFLPLRGSNAEKNKNKLWVSKRQFQTHAKKAKKLFLKFFDVNSVRVGARNHAYFIIGSDGSVMIPTESKKICENKKVGSIFDDNIINKWQKFGSISNFNKNSKEILELINKTNSAL